MRRIITYEPAILNYGAWRKIKPMAIKAVEEMGEIPISTTSLLEELKMCYFLWNGHPVTTGDEIRGVDPFDCESTLACLEINSQLGAPSFICYSDWNEYYLAVATLLLMQDKARKQLEASREKDGAMSDEEVDSNV